MKKLLMWAVGVPFMVFSMAMFTFSERPTSTWTEAAANGPVIQHR